MCRKARNAGELAVKPLADPSVAFDVELQADRRLRVRLRPWLSAGAGRAQRRGGFPRRDALECNSRLDHRSRCQALSQGSRHGGAACLPQHGGAARLSRPCPVREPVGPLRRRLHAARVAALAMIEPGADRPQSITLGADRGDDAADFVNELRSMNVRPHVAPNLTRRRGRSAIDGRTTRHPGDAASQRNGKRIEGSAWMKAVAGLERPKLRCVYRVGWAFTFAACACRSCWRRRHERGHPRIARQPRRGRTTLGRTPSTLTRSSAALQSLRKWRARKTPPPKARLLQQPARPRPL